MLVNSRPSGRVRITNPRAKMRNTAIDHVGSFSIISLISAAASATPMAAATVVFLVSAIRR